MNAVKRISSVSAFLPSILIVCILFISCTKTVTEPEPQPDPQPTEKACRLDSIRIKTDPGVTGFLNTIFVYDSNSKLIRKDYYSTGYLYQHEEFGYDNLGRASTESLFDVSNKKMYQITGFFDSQTKKPVGYIYDKFFMTPPETDSVLFVIGTDKVSVIFRNNKKENFRIDHEYENGNHVRTYSYTKGVLTLADTISYTSIPAISTDFIPKPTFISDEIKSKNLPERRIIYDFVRGRRVMDETYTYELNDEGEVVKRDVKGHLTPEPGFPGNLKQYWYFWNCD